MSRGGKWSPEKEKGGSGKPRNRLPTENSQSVSTRSHSIENLSNSENVSRGGAGNAEVLSNIKYALNGAEVALL